MGSKRGKNQVSAGQSAIRPRSRRRKWAFRLIAATVVPTLLLMLIEVALRLAGYGYDTSYFAKLPNGDRLCGNPRFGWRFFPPAVARMPPPFAIDAKKKPGTYRIFVLGSSAALGFPDPSFSFARVLEAMLREGFPKARFEVVNTAMIAVNSHVVLPVARDCAEREPDLFIVYEGNNEVVGPFGPGTVFADFSRRLWAVRLQLAAGRLRLVQGMHNLAAGLSRSDEVPAEWHGMEFFLDRPVAADDARLDDVYDHFKRNLLAICAAGGAKVLLCTVGVNLRDCAPFASTHRSGLNADEKRRWEALCAEAADSERRADPSAALEKLRAAAAIDDAHAELHFRLARCLDALTRHDEARRHYEHARDLDTLRFRTDSRANAIIRRAASEAGMGVHLVDVERAMAETDPSWHGAPGRELFYEHCHMTFRGNYVIARALFEQIAPLLPSEISATGSAAPTPCSLERCAERLAYTPYGERQALETINGLLNRPPFTGQWDADEQLARARDRLAALSVRQTPGALAEWSSRFEAALALSPEDADLHRNYATLLRASNNASAADKHLRAALKALPFDPSLLVDLGALLVSKGDRAGGDAQFREALASPRCDLGCQADVHFNLGLVAHQARDLSNARTHYEAALRCRPSRTDAHTNLGQLLLQLGDADGALRHYRAAIELDPQGVGNYLNMASACANLNRLDEAEKALRSAIALAPQEPSIRAALAELLARKGGSGAATRPVEPSTPSNSLDSKDPRDRQSRER